MAVITGTNVRNRLFGTAAADTIRGLGGNDDLFGKAGNDRLEGGTGNDLLDGGLGIDTMLGGTGNDTYIVDQASDRAIELAGQGIDLVKSKVSFTLGANVEKLTLTGSANINGRGNALANTLTGNAGNNVLESGAGADKHIGGAGADWVSYAHATSRVGMDLLDNLGNLGDATGDTFSGIENIRGSDFNDGGGLVGGFGLYGNDGNNIIEGLGGDDTLVGRGGNDTLLGGTGADIMDGEIGNDILEGGAGADVMDGGIGNDTLEGGAGADQHIGGDGLDWVSYEHSASGVGMDLGANLGNLGDANGDTFSGIELIRGTNSNDGGGLVGGFGLYGDNVANIIEGLGGDDTLVGQSGDDRLYGGTGNDVLDGGLGGDFLDGGAGADSIDCGPDGFSDGVFLHIDAADTIINFRSSEGDRLVLSIAETGIPIASLGVNYFEGNNLPNNTHGTSGTPILYHAKVNPDSLHYDSDGAGGALPVTIAIFAFAVSVHFEFVA